MCHGRISISFFQQEWVAHASVKWSIDIHCYATFTVFYSKLFVTLLGKAFFQYALIRTEAVCVAILNLKKILKYEMIYTHCFLNLPPPFTFWVVVVA